MSAELLMNTMFAYGAQAVTRDRYDELGTEFLHLFNGVRLFGTQPVIDAAFELNHIHYEVFNTYMQDRSARPFHEKMSDAFVEHGDALVKARVKCFDTCCCERS